MIFSCKFIENEYIYNNYFKIPTEIIRVPCAYFAQSTTPRFSMFRIFKRQIRDFIGCGKYGCRSNAWWPIFKKASFCWHNQSTRTSQEPIIIYYNNTYSSVKQPFLRRRTACICISLRTRTRTFDIRQYDFCGPWNQKSDESCRCVELACKESDEAEGRYGS